MVKDNPKRFPDFFTVYLDAERLLIPPPFLDCLNGDMPENTILRNYEGVCWNVKVKKTEQGTFFHKGWKRFLQQNSINVEEFLVFRYNGSLFDCRVFGHSMCEKNDPPSREKGKKPVEVKEEHGDDEIKKEEEDDDDDDDSKEEDDDDDDDVNDYNEEEEEDEGIVDMQLNSLSFEEPYKRGPRRKLRIPVHVIRDNNLQLAKKMVYQDPVDREWEGEVSVWGDGTTWIGGWGLLCQKNSVKEGDKCICEFVLDRGEHQCSGFRCSHRSSRMKVQIIRRSLDQN